MNNKSHQSETFDSLRAGLHGADVDFKDPYTVKLIDQENEYWQRIAETLEEGVTHDRAAGNRLRIRRRQVLNGEYTRGSRRVFSPVAAGAAAGIVVFLGAAIWWEAVHNEPGPVTRTASVGSADVEKAEFANNIDFYTWLEQQSDTVADSGGG